MSVVAAQLIGTVEILGADESIALLEAVGAACDALDVQLAALGTGAGDAMAASLGVADEALVGLQATADATAASLAVLGDNAGGLSALAAQAVEADASLSALDANMAELSAMTAQGATDASVLADSLATTALAAGDADVAIAATDASLSSLATVAVDAATGADVMASSLANVTVSSDVMQAALAANGVVLSETGAALATTAAEADSAGFSLEFFSGAADAASASVDALLSVLGAVAIALAVLGVAAAAMGIISLKMAGDFQAGMTSLVTGAGESEANIKMVSAAILQMSIDTATSTKQLTDGMYMIESAGFHGAAGLLVLKAAAEGAKVGNADLAAVANGVTTALTDYHLSASQAVAVTNDLIATVAAGKTHMQDLATALATILPTSSAVGVSLRDTSAAMATMTGEGTNAASAATYLRQLLIALEAPAAKGAKALKEIGLTTGEVSSEMRKSLPGALQLIMDHLAETYTVGSPQYIEALKNIAGGSRQMQGILELTGTHLQTFKDNVDAISAAVQKGGTSITGWNLVQGDFNFKVEQAWRAIQALFIVIGTQLLPEVGKIVGAITPVITSFIEWLGKTNAIGHGIDAVVGFIHQLVDAFNQVFNPVQKTANAMKPLTDTFDRATGVFHQVHDASKPLLDSFDRATGVFNKTGTSAHGTVQAINPFVSIFQNIANAIKTAIAIFNGIVTAINFVHDVFMKLLPILQNIGGFLVSTFTPVWKQLVQAFGDIQKALQPIMPQLIQFAQFIGGVLVVAVVLAISIIAGLVAAFAGLLKGVIQVVTGVIQFIAGLVQFLTGAISFIVDLFTGHFDKLAGDLNKIMSGIMINIFQMLASVIVGHSIIPDMVNSIVNWFQQLPSRALGAVQPLLGMIGGFFSNLASQAIQWGSNIINNVATGITNAMGTVATAVGNVVNFIASHLPHSPAKIGPLRDLEYSGSQITNQLSQGMLSAMPRLQASLNLMLSPLVSGANTGSSSFSSGGIAYQFPSMAAASPSSPQIIVQQPDIIIDGMRLTNKLMPYLASNIRLGTGITGR